MLAVDTNIVVRFLTGDEPAQAEGARAIFERETVLLLKTVILETEWVLRSLYRFNRVRIADAFMAMIALPAVECEDLNAIAKAIGWMRNGLDLSDALHLASAKPAGKFATFDRELAKRSIKIADIPMIRV
ncbi:MAG: type II toxin-antitoxin system VapC family toxin [Deltaproteobacteria bacterium]|nr:type II toxin-antitoxin system VapC family toxin [Deltaproteobacteria bacterium]